MTDESGRPGTRSTPSDHGNRRQDLQTAPVLRPDGSGGSPPGQDRHRVLRELRAELARHPAVRNVTGDPPEALRELRADVAPGWFDRQAAEASLRFTWVPDPRPGPSDEAWTGDPWSRTPIQAFYTLHYSESSGFDCGFHCEPNPHVDGLLHYQARSDPDTAYVYEPVRFSARSVSGLLWEMVDGLAARLRGTA